MLRSQVPSKLGLAALLKGDRHSAAVASTPPPNGTCFMSSKVSTRNAFSPLQQWVPGVMAVVEDHDEPAQSLYVSGRLAVEVFGQ